MFPRLDFWRFMKHINIPIFIPHLGCPNACVFCNQRSISGRESFDPQCIEQEIEEVLSTVPTDAVTEVAFFGGSFTGLERDLMVELLEKAEKYVRRGRVSGIRLSTRPDYIDEQILKILSRYSVKTIELGLQSMDDKVLLASMRGHTAEEGRTACRLVKQYGFSLIGQMMLGLPSSDLQAEIMTAETLCALGVDGARIYPTVVFEDTVLCDMAKTGRYQPLTLEDAVVRTAEVLKVFARHDVPCIRVGLCASENLASDKVFGGANHSAIGELAMGEIFFDRMCHVIENWGSVEGKQLIVYVPQGAISRAVGQKRKNLDRIYKKYSPLRVKVLEKNELMSYNIMIEVF